MKIIEMLVAGLCIPGGMPRISIRSGEVGAFRMCEMGIFRPNLEKMKANRDVEELIKALKDKNADIRGKATEVLG